MFQWWRSDFVLLHCSLRSFIYPLSGLPYRLPTFSFFIRFYFQPDRPTTTIFVCCYILLVSRCTMELRWIHTTQQNTMRRERKIKEIIKIHCACLLAIYKKNYVEVNVLCGFLKLLLNKIQTFHRNDENLWNVYNLKHEIIYPVQMQEKRPCIFIQKRIEQSATALTTDNTTTTTTNTSNVTKQLCSASF